MLFLWPLLSLPQLWGARVSTCVGSIVVDVFSVVKRGLGIDPFEVLKRFVLLARTTSLFSATRQSEAKLSRTFGGLERRCREPTLETQGTFAQVSPEAVAWLEASGSESF